MATTIRFKVLTAGVSVDFKAHAPVSANSSTIGKLTVTLNHVGLIWSGFSLKQNAAAEMNSAVSGGLRLLLDMIDKNGMVLSWVDYHIRAVDSTPVNDPNQAGHLADAHFHNTNDAFASTPLVLQGNGDSVKQLNFGLGAAVAPAATFTASNILLHEGSFAGVQRDFRVESIPSVVPEPTSLLFWSALGLIGAVAYRRRRNAGKAEWVVPGSSYVLLHRRGKAGCKNQAAATGNAPTP